MPVLLEPFPVIRHLISERLQSSSKKRMKITTKRVSYQPTSIEVIPMLIASFDQWKDELVESLSIILFSRNDPGYSDQMDCFYIIRCLMPWTKPISYQLVRWSPHFMLYFLTSTWADEPEWMRLYGTIPWVDIGILSWFDVGTNCTLHLSLHSKAYIHQRKLWTLFLHHRMEWRKEYWIWVRIGQSQVRTCRHIDSDTQIPNSLG